MGRFGLFHAGGRLLGGRPIPGLFGRLGLFQAGGRPLPGMPVLGRLGRLGLFQDGGRPLVGRLALGRFGRLGRIVGLGRDIGRLGRRLGRGLATGLLKLGLGRAEGNGRGRLIEGRVCGRGRLIAGFCAGPRKPPRCASALFVSKDSVRMASGDENNIAIAAAVERRNFFMIFTLFAGFNITATGLCTQLRQCDSA